MIHSEKHRLANRGKHMKSKQYRFTGQLAVAVGLASAALAGAASAQGSKPAVLEEVIVTAQKRQENISDIPQSIQVLDQQVLVESSIRDVAELINFIPGASEGLATSVGQRRIQIRGIYQESGSATVGYYLDEAPIDGDTAAPMGRLYDMAQVEILRGPQSTLWGNGAMGGVVRYIPNLPDLSEVRAGARVGYSSTEGGDDGNYGDVFLSVPLIEDTLGFRLVGSREQLGGWQDILNGPEDFNEAELLDFRATVLWEPSDNWRARFMYSNNEADQDGGLLLSGLFPDDTITTSSPRDFNNTEMEVFSGVLEYTGFERFDIVTIVSSVEYFQDSNLFLELPGLSAVTSSQQTGIDTLSNETRLVSKGDSPLQWMVGSFITDRESTTNAILDWEPEIPPFFTDSVFDNVDQRDSMAFFGEFSWSLMNGKLVPLVGVRWAEEEFEGDSVRAAGIEGSKTFDTVNYRFNLSWFPAEDRQYYVNVAEGFRSGVFNLAATCETHNLLLVEGRCELSQDSDELISYEVGGKFTLLGGRMYLDAAAYFIDWQRTPQQFPVGGLFATYNIGDSEIYGIDFSMVYQPEFIDGLSLNLVANWIDAEFTDVNTYIAQSLQPPFAEQSVGADEGQSLPFVPGHTLTLGVDYSRDIGAGWTVLGNAAWNRIDGQFGQFGANTQRGDTRDLLRLRVGFEKNDLGVFLFGRNLLDADGAIFAQNPTDGIPIFTRDYPRQLGLELTYNFN
jgi:outer membrane receptor protein involved in Fe transport